MKAHREIFISVDVETAGPIPGEYSLLAIGACDAYQPDKTVFSCEVKPITQNYDPKALEVTGLSLDRLTRDGLAPAEAMRSFQNWLEAVCGPDSTPVFVGFNAPFDWSFVNYYFHRFLGHNPFGISSLDIKSMYMGVTRSSWSDTRSSSIASVLKPSRHGDHSALHDAQYQAELFCLIRHHSADAGCGPLD
jgi:DNA polymerase III epsilon subunit-like protein